MEQDWVEVSKWNLGPSLRVYICVWPWIFEDKIFIGDNCMGIAELNCIFFVLAFGKLRQK